VLARTQDSVAVRSARGDVVLVNASPDIHAQIEKAPELQPRAPRHSPIRAVVLTNGDLDHVLGLFSLRESQPFELWATDAVWRGLVEGNAIFRTLQRFRTQVTWRRIALGQEVEVVPGVALRAFPVPGKLPVHLVGAREPSPEDNIGVVLRSGDVRVAYVSSAGALGAFVEELEGTRCLFFDGTFWSSDELVALGLSKARAEDMAHLPVGGPQGSLAMLARVRAGRKILTHVNNTNPILVDGSPERRAVEEAGWEVARDGMEIQA
jgi:pyrroloquinoline quinone biosynthesis protein B